MIVQTDPRRPCVVLVGPPGAGKSTIGRRLARELGVDLYDTDAGIEEESGRTIPEIFAVDGEPEFRRIEERVVRRAVLQHKGVVSLGGGAVLSAATRELLRERTVVYLEISIAEGLRRTGANSNRPLLAGDDPGAKYRRLMRERRPLYREVASVRVRTDGRSPGRVVRAILAKLGVEPVEPPAPPDDGEGVARRSRSRRRRRRGRSKATADTATAESGLAAAPPDRDRRPSGETSQDTATTSNTVVAEEDPAIAESPPAKRRSRRSRRGGRRRPRAATAPGEDTTATGGATATTETDDRTTEFVRSGIAPNDDPDGPSLAKETASDSPAAARRNGNTRRRRAGTRGPGTARTNNYSVAAQPISDRTRDPGRTGEQNAGTPADGSRASEPSRARAPERRRRTASRPAGPPTADLAGTPGPAPASSAPPPPGEAPQNSPSQPTRSNTTGEPSATSDHNSPQPRTDNRDDLSKIAAEQHVPEQGTQSEPTRSTERRPDPVRHRSGTGTPPGSEPNTVRHPAVADTGRPIEPARRNPPEHPADGSSANDSKHPAGQSVSSPEPDRRPDGPAPTRAESEQQT